MRTRLFTLLTVACLAAPASTQIATYTFFGTGCSSPAVPFQVSGLPRIGGSFVVQTLPPTFSQFGIRTELVLTGLSNQSIGGVPLPFDTSVLSGGNLVFCGPLLTSSEVALLSPPDMGSGFGELTFTIPADPSLLGAVFYQQVLDQYQARGGPTTISLSVGGQANVGL